MDDATKAALRDAIRAAFDAGIEQGADEAAAYERGGCPSFTSGQAFIDFMSDWNPDSGPLRDVLALIERAGLVDHTEAVRRAYEECAAIAIKYEPQHEMNSTLSLRIAANISAVILARRDEVCGQTYPLEKETEK